MQRATTVDRRTRTRADKAKERIRKMIVEQTNHTGKRPTVVRVRLADHLALVECGYVRDNVLSGDPKQLQVLVA